MTSKPPNWYNMIHVIWRSNGSILPKIAIFLENKASAINAINTNLKLVSHCGHFRVFLPKLIFLVIWREMCHSNTGVNYWEKEWVTNLPRKGTLVKVWWVKMVVQISMIFCENQVLHSNESFYIKITLYRHLWSMIHSRLTWYFCLLH